MKKMIYLMLFLVLAGATAVYASSFINSMDDEYSMDDDNMDDERGYDED
jgi:hypothetical protein